VPAIEQPCRLLIIDDNAADVRLLLLALEECGLAAATDVFADGRAALEYVGRHGNDEAAHQPDAVLLDLMLPGATGEELLRAIRATTYMRAAPVALLTSSFSTRDRDRLLALGLDFYLTKPADLDEFMSIGETVRRMLRK